MEERERVREEERKMINKWWWWAVEGLFWVWVGVIGGRERERQRDREEERDSIVLFYLIV